MGLPDRDEDDGVRWWRAAAGCLAAALLIGGVVRAASSARDDGDPVQRIWIAGDSTASPYGPERAPRTGWGQVFGSWFGPGIAVENRAQNGRSSRSYIEEGWFGQYEARIASGDLLLIQFGHNDGKRDDPTRYNEPGAAFRQWLTRYVEVARKAGATPVLITPVARREFAADEPVDTHGPYARTVHELAAALDVPLIDLGQRSMDLLRVLGPESSRAWFLRDAATGDDDNTHFSTYGAHAMACLVADGLKQLALVAATGFVRDTDCGAPADALQSLAAQSRPSAIQHAADIAVQQPGPHGGAGTTTAWPFFRDAPGLGFVFRKRALHPGASIGVHFHDYDEIYYVLEGEGDYVLDGVTRRVVSGDALLTRAGSTHSMRQAGAGDLVLLIAYPKATPL